MSLNFNTCPNLHHTIKPSLSLNGPNPRSLTLYKLHFTLSFSQPQTKSTLFVKILQSFSLPFSSDSS